MAKRKLYLIHPTFDLASVVEVNFLPGAVGMANAALGTVAALAPADRFEVRLCEEDVEPVDFDYPADFVGITGKHGQGERMRAIAAEFRARGVTVLMGGPYASLAPEEVREHCDVLVRGELEPIAQRFFEDLYEGNFQHEYFGERASLEGSPVPRWDLYPSERALMGSLQTSRGCPFECEFCDVIQYVGRKQRHKSVDQVCNELDALYAAGFRRVFLADDNLTVFRKRAKELLAGIAQWNARQPEPMSFGTQLSIECSDDSEMLELLYEAGLHSVFIGIETPNQDSLKETKKRQNVDVDMVERAERFARQGLQVVAGAIVGFDHDGPDIFEQQLEFAMRSPIPVFRVSTLYAAHATPLRERMRRDGRLLPIDIAMGSHTTNIMPARMSLAELERGFLWLNEQLFAPDNFARRVLRMIELFPEQGRNWQVSERAVDAELALATHGLLASESPEMSDALGRILKAIRRKPSARRAGMYALLMWAQQLHTSRQLAAAPRPPLPTVQVVHAGSANRALTVIG